MAIDVIKFRIKVGRVNDRLLALRDDPRPPGVRKLAGAMAGWRIPADDYRILYQIDDEARTVTVVRVRHRREVHR